MSKKDDLPFEASLVELKKRIEELRNDAENTPGLKELLSSMQEKGNEVEKQLYENLSPWNTVEVARHPKRPQTRDYIDLMLDEFVELHGDRQFRDDLSIVTGLAQIGSHRVMLVGQHKGRDVTERHQCHAGCPHPEGYWKSLRKMRIAEQFGLPVVCLIDTKGAYPGIGSEERGVAIAIAENMRDMSKLKVPIVCVIIGEGGSGGALGLGVGNRILMLRHAYYSVISPEGCASILWRDGNKKAAAAGVLKLTSRDLQGFGLIDEIVDEPLGGAHRNPQVMAATLRAAIIRNLDELSRLSPTQLAQERYEKFRAYGRFTVEKNPPELPEFRDEESIPDEEEGDVA